MKDLFEYPELIPENIQAIMDSADEDKDPYKECERMLEEMNELGYTFEYGLDGVPFGLTKLENSDSEKEPKTKSCDLDFMVQELTLMGDRISEMENRNAKMEDAIKTVIDQMENGKDEKYDIFLNVLRTAIDK